MLGAGMEGVFEPGLFGDADAVLAGDGAAPGDDLVEEFVEGLVGFGFLCGVSGVGDHDVDVDVAVAGVAEAGDGEAG